MAQRCIGLFLLLLVASWVTSEVQAQTLGTCRLPGSRTYLDINNVRAFIPNDGSLFIANGATYEVPAGGGVNAIWAANLEIGGLVGGELRTSVGRFERPRSMWAGPIFPGVQPPPDCDVFDRIYKVNREDVVAFEAGGSATQDLRDWPTGLGAPTLSAEGHRIVLQGNGTLAYVNAEGGVVRTEVLSFEDRLNRRINLAAGERPELQGDQMLWWIMNDLGNLHGVPGSLPIGVEVHASVFGFNVPGVIGNTTFYKYRLYYKGDQPFEEAYVGMHFDADVGYFSDDYIGVDTTLGLGFMYNADNEDETDRGYGTSPPAVGVDFFQGPVADPDGLDNDLDGVVDEPGERLQMTAFVRGINRNFGGTGIFVDPETALQYYNNMQGLFIDGSPITVGGADGQGFSTQRTKFHFSGAAEEGAFWSEVNIDGQGNMNPQRDQRFNMFSGPFTMQPGDVEEIVFGIIWSQGDDHLDSVRQLKEDNALAQSIFDINFALPAPPAPPRVTATGLDEQVILEWTYAPTDNNYLDSYHAVDPLLSPDITDNAYEFEGYRVFQYTDPGDGVGTLLATYDVPNGVTQVVEGDVLTFVTAEGTDSGVQHHHAIDGLTNYQNYFFGVQAYAYNAESGRQVFNGPVTRVEVVPTRSRDILSSDAMAAAANTLVPDIEAERPETNIGNGSASADIINPAAVTGDTYEVRFFRAEAVEGKRTASAVGPITYDIVNATTGEKRFDGQVAFEATGSAAPEGTAVQLVDGLQFNIFGPPNGFLDFTTVSNASGPLAEPDGASADWAGFPGVGRPSDNQQVGEGRWIIHTGDNGARGPYPAFIFRSVESRPSGWSNLVPFDFEWRFTERCLANYNANVAAPGCLGWDFFGIRNFEVIPVPFELWRIGVGTPDDTGDDIRLIPYIIDIEGDGWGLWNADHSGSGGDNDPQSDWVYWYLPADLSPGERGYNAWEAAALALPVGANGFPAAPSRGDFIGAEVSGEVMGRIVVFNWDGGDIGGPYNQLLPEPGTTFRIITTKTNQPGDALVIATAGFGAAGQTPEHQATALSSIGIVPNPYKGASAYEVSQQADEVRFTNMPAQATIRVFDLAGTLVRRLEKNSASTFFRWDLRTDNNLPLASGMYFIHIEVPGVGEHALKFAVVRKGSRLNSF